MCPSLRIAAEEKASLITLPLTSVTYNPYGDTVFVVDEHGKDAQGKPALIAQQRFVKLGSTRGDQVAVLSGIEPGEVVVTAGQLKLRNGTAGAAKHTAGPKNHRPPTTP